MRYYRHWIDKNKDLKNYKTLVNYSLQYYKKHFTTEEIGKEIMKGLKYKNVTVIPYKLRTKIEEAISNQVSTIIELNSLYDKQLNKKLIRIIKIRQGLAKK